MPQSPIQLPSILDPHYQCSILSLSVIPAKGYVLYENADQLLRAADDGGRCTLCAALLRALGSNLRVRTINGAQVILYPNPPHDKGPLQRVEVLFVSKANAEGLGWSSDTEGRWFIGPPDPKPWLARGHLTVYAAQGVHTPNHQESLRIKYRKPEANAQSPQCLNLAKQWLKNCGENHGATCRVPRQGSPLPTRVIDVGSSSSDGKEELPHLVWNTAGRLDRYVALSYRWGTEPFVTLNSAEKDAFEASIPLDDLPSTIREAIVVTRSLGIRYLWVDSLCIMQGESAEAVEDWKRESQNMHQVFRGACFTLMASASSNAHEGLFIDRRLQEDQFCEIRVFPSHRERTETAYLGPDPYQRPILEEKLHERGWVYQEAFLSIRALSFGSNELVWRCRDGEYRETLTDKAWDPLPPVQDNPSAIRKNWTAIVEEYSSKNLTRATDRLPAIAGIARLGDPDMVGKGYLFGLWEDQLSWSLVWRRQAPERKGDNHGGPINGSQDSRRHCIAPSWSWACAEGRVTFLGEEAHKICVKPFDFNSGTLLIQGRMRKISSLRLKTSASYYGGYDNFRPWARYPTTMKTYLDDPDGIPTHHRLTAPDGPDQLVDVWFLYFGRDSGLILIPEEAGDEVIYHHRSMMERLCMRSVVLFRRPFRRIGVFLGLNVKDKVKTRILLI